jgi:hypothetical protein
MGMPIGATAFRHANPPCTATEFFWQYPAPNSHLLCQPPKAGRSSAARVVTTLLLVVIANEAPDADQGFVVTAQFKRFQQLSAGLKRGIVSGFRNIASKIMRIAQAAPL